MDMSVSKSWYVDGKPHRLDGPAIEYVNGSKGWWVNGYLHRLNGPAIESVDGLRMWYVDGKLHRIDGPAVIYANEYSFGYSIGYNAWYVDGEKSTEEKVRAIHLLAKRWNIILPYFRVLNITPGKFMRLRRLIKTKEFNEWFYSPEQPGGKLAKAKLSTFISKTSSMRVRDGFSKICSTPKGIQTGP